MVSTCGRMGEDRKPRKHDKREEDQRKTKKTYMDGIDQMTRKKGWG